MESINSKGSKLITGIWMHNGKARLQWMFAASMELNVHGWYPTRDEAEEIVLGMHARFENR